MAFFPILDMSRLLILGDKDMCFRVAEFLQGVRNCFQFNFLDISALFSWLIAQMYFRQLCTIKELFGTKGEVEVWSMKLR